MAVDTPSAKYTEMLPEWQKCKDFYASEKIAQSKGVLYCAKPAGQDDDEYKAYLTRASLSMFFKKTVDTYQGMATRKAVHVTDADSIEEYLENVTGSGESLSEYTYGSLGKFFTTGRAGTLLTLPVGKTYSDPMFKFYNEMSIIFAREEVIDGKTVLVEVRLKEVVDKKIGGFDYEESWQIRVLDLDDGKYRVRVYDDSNTQVGEDVYPLIDNKSLDYIPFKIHGGVAIKSPFLIEIADLNKHHYRLTCEFYNSMYQVTQPQRWLAGVDKKEIPKEAGGTTLWAFNDHEATANIMESQGFAHGDYKEERKQIKETISALAVNMILDTEGDTTATQANIDSSNQTASLAGIVNNISQDLTQLLEWACEWMSKECGQVQINTDFVSKKMSPEMIRELRASWFEGAISKATMWANFQQGEIGDPHKTLEEEQSDIDDNMPAGMDGSTE